MMFRLLAKLFAKREPSEWEQVCYDRSEEHGPPVPEPVPAFDMDWDAATDDERDRWVAYYVFGRRKPFGWSSAGSYIYEDGKVGEISAWSSGMYPEHKTYDHVRTSVRRQNQLRDVYIWRAVSDCENYTTSADDLDVLEFVREHWRGDDLWNYRLTFSDCLEHIWDLSPEGKDPIAYRLGDYSRAVFMTLQELGPCPIPNPESTPTEPASAV
jgi:hypothetical protein